MTSIPVEIVQFSLERDAAERERLYRLLSDDEKQRAARYHFDLHRNRFVVGRASIRRILADRAGCDARDLAFELNEFGKPSLALPEAARGIDFSASSSASLGAVAVADGMALGFDVENLRPDRIVDCDSIVRNQFSGAEHEWYRQQPKSRRWRVFFEFWTCKEAYLKALGVGLSGGLDSFSIDLSTGEPEVGETGLEPEQRTRYSLRRVVLDDDYLACLNSIIIERSARILMLIKGCKPLLVSLHVFVALACNAGDVVKQDTPGSVTSKKTPVMQHQPRARDEVYRSSAYRPSGLLLDIDFEDDNLQPGQERLKNTHEMLQFKMPDGQPSAVGVNYEGGTRDDARARIVIDPEDKNNHVLNFWIKNAAVPGYRKGHTKGRIQLEFQQLNMTSLFYRYRFYLHPDIGLYRDYPRLNRWLGLATLWMGDRWRGHLLPFKISLNLYKPEGVGKPMYFAASGDLYSASIRNWYSKWYQIGDNFEVPVGEWIDVEIGYKAGNDKTGRYYLAAKRAKDKNLTTIFDLTDWTYNPYSPIAIPLTTINPIKLYSSDQIFHFIRDRGGVAQIYWDDLEAYSNW